MNIDNNDPPVYIHFWDKEGLDIFGMYLHVPYATIVNNLKYTLLSTNNILYYAASALFESSYVNRVIVDFPGLFDVKNRLIATVLSYQDLFNYVAFKQEQYRYNKEEYKNYFNDYWKIVLNMDIYTIIHNGGTTERIGDYFLLNVNKQKIIEVANRIFPLSYSKNDIDIILPYIKLRVEERGETAITHHLFAKDMDKRNINQIVRKSSNILIVERFTNEYLQYFGGTIATGLQGVTGYFDFLSPTYPVNDIHIWRAIYDYIGCQEYISKMNEKQIVTIRKEEEYKKFIIRVRAFVSDLFKNENNMRQHKPTYAAQRLWNLQCIYSKVTSMKTFITQLKRVNLLFEKYEKISSDINHDEKKIFTYEESWKMKENLIDVMILIATLDEERAILELGDWAEAKMKNGDTFFMRKYKDINFALVRGTDMGETDAAITGQAFISEFNPKYIAMAGFCAGQAGKVNLGDIIVPRMVYRYGDGKQISDTTTLPEISSLRLNPIWIHKVERFGEEWRKQYSLSMPKQYEAQNYLFITRVLEHLEEPFSPQDVWNSEELPHFSIIFDKYKQANYLYMSEGMITVTQEGKSFFKEEHGLKYWNGYTDSMPETKTGVLATGANVQQWSGIFEKLSANYDRRTIALDMEAFAVAQLSEKNNNIPWIIAKGIGDYAQDGKAFDNRFIPFACKTSCCFLMEFFVKII